MRPLPATAEILEEIALREPRLPAFAEEGAQLDHGEFYGMVAQCALWLQRLGVQRGQRIAVAGPGCGVQLVLLIAAEGLGLVTASFSAEDDPDAPALFAHVHWVFAARPQQVPPGVQFQGLDGAVAQAWARPLGAERPAWNACAADEPQRISRTSGSTGASKFMLLPRAAQEYWVTNGRDKHSFGPGSRLLLLGPFVMNAALSRSSACLRRGGMVLAPASGALLPQLLPTQVWGLPAQLEQLLAQAPPDWTAPRAADVVTVGGALHPALREKAERTFRSRVLNRYGSNEAGPISEDLDASGTGLLVPGVDLRILDAEGRDAPAGEAGRIAVRTPCTVAGYLARPEETAAAFRDGWFLSGDVGLLVGPRRLRLLGRLDDLVNLGGLKVPAAQIEAALRAEPGVADCSVQALHQAGGAVTLGLALVLAPGISQGDLAPRIRAAVRAPAETQLRVLTVAALPRLRNGKVDRLQLLRHFQQQD